MSKIIFYIDSMQKNGGANRVMANLTSCFAEDGNDIILITDVGPRSNIFEYRINNLVKRICLDEVIEEKSCSNYRRIKTIRQIIKNENPNVVISFMGPPNIRMLLASIGLKPRKIISVRSDPNFEYGTGIKKLLKCAILSLADGYVFQTCDAANYFSKKIQKKSKIIYNPVGKEFFDVKNNGIERNIISVGRLHPAKNQELLIRAFGQISEKYPEEKLIIYGEGPSRSKLEKLIKETGLTDRVLLPGNIDNVAEKLSEGKIFVLSSNFEGMPNALMEAMAAGMAVVSTNCPCGGPRELLGTNDRGILVPCNSIEKMAEAMDILEEDYNLRRNMQEAASTKAHEFSSKNVLKQWKSIIE